MQPDTIQIIDEPWPPVVNTEIHEHVPDEKPPGTEAATRVAPVTTFTARELMDTEFPEPKWAVPGLICEGLNLLGGSPKVGKSWLGLNFSVDVARGGYALGRVKVDRGKVLYLALEDTGRRLKSRLRMVLDGEPAPDGLTFATDWPRMSEGGVDRLERTLDQNPDIRLIVVDVLAKVRENTGGKQQQLYAADYAAMEVFKKIADAYTVAIVVVHHTRKSGADDFLDTISGTQGLAGACDGVLVLSRSRGRADAELNITGRDVEEAQYALKFDQTRGLWTVVGDAEKFRMSGERQQIIEAVTAAGGLKPKEIAAATMIDYDVVRQLVRKMLDADQLDTDGRGTYLPFVHSVHSGNGHGPETLL